MRVSRTNFPIVPFRSPHAPAIKKNLTRTTGELNFEYQPFRPIRPLLRSRVVKISEAESVTHGPSAVRRGRTAICRITRRGRRVTAPGHANVPAVEPPLR
ncbi:hypothetical protein EVAR_23633_1 [Eumeta japonica]|uniref:Uncharacterized protein n=1 Tax=Eumeta variegata TaxID=151549 RepID=A0A4C1VIL6_EUMVA|nr:hypothetical protein EVAR_23633_1 [Eumeta japonica]